MSGRLTLTMITVAELHIADLLLLPGAPSHEPITVEVTRLQALPRSGRIRVWVRSTHRQRTVLSPWNYGAFEPTAPIQRMEFA